MKWAGLETPKCVTVHQRVNDNCAILWCQIAIPQMTVAPYGYIFYHNWLYVLLKITDMDLYMTTTVEPPLMVTLYNG